MKSTNTIPALILTGLFTLIGGAIPLYAFYSLWHYCISLVPANESAQLFKIGITLGMVFFGGSITIGLAVVGAIFSGGIVAAITGALD